jgi:cytochrome c-type biogenesis protein CcmH/NrfG
MACEKKGMNREALEAYTNAYTINPESADAADGIRRMKILEIQKKYKE